MTLSTGLMFLALAGALETDWRQKQLELLDAL
jgi:hypothetical protein